jgi:hypothetical protein
MSEGERVRPGYADLARLVGKTVVTARRAEDADEGVQLVFDDFTNLEVRFSRYEGEGTVSLNGIAFRKVEPPKGGDS